MGNQKNEENEENEISEMTKDELDSENDNDLIELDRSKINANLSATALAVANFQKFEGLATLANTKTDWSKINANLSTATLTAADLSKFAGLATLANTKMDWSKVSDTLSAATLSVANLSKFTELATLASTKMDWPKVNATLSTATLSVADLPKFEGLAAYTGALVNSGLIDGNFNLSQSIAEMSELSQEVQEEPESLKESIFQDYSEEHIQFILDSLEEWLEGSISFKSTLERVKGNRFIYDLMKTIVYGTIFQLICIFAFIDDPQIQQDREVLETVQHYMETEVTVYQQYKKYFANSEEAFASRSLGLTRKEVRLREGRSRTAPMVVDGVVGQKTVVLMFEVKNNWRQVEVKINGTFVKGWVPESTITRLKPVLEK